MGAGDLEMNGCGSKPKYRVTSWGLLLSRFLVFWEGVQLGSLLGPCGC